MQKIRCGICIIISFLFCLMVPCISFKGFTVADAENGKLVIHFVNVGQGDCSIIELPDGKVVIIDAGSKDNGNIVVEYLNVLGINTIDYLIATHSDSDHIGGFIEVLKNKEVKNIYRPFDLCKTILPNGYVDELYTMFANTVNIANVVDSTIYAEFLSLAYSETINGELSHINVITNKVNIASESGTPYLIKCFYPQGNEQFSTARIENGYTVKLTKDQNETSCVVGVFTENHKYLFMGDLPSSEESNMVSKISQLEREQLSNVTVLKVAHHGSENSTSQGLLNLTKPKYAVIQVGENNYGHPSADVLTRLNNSGAEVFRTDLDGTIIVEENLGQVMVRALGIEKSTSYAWIFYCLLAIVALGIIFLIIFWNKIKLWFAKIKLQKIK